MPDFKKAATLLLVDDDHVNRIAFSRALKKLQAGNDLVTAEDGLEALEFLHNAVALNKGVLPPVIVLLDIHMPRMNGLEFCSAVSGSRCFDGLVIYAFGTADMPAAVRSALDEQVAGYLTKDKPLETLVSALASKSAAVQGAQRLQ